MLRRRATSAESVLVPTPVAPPISTTTGSVDSRRTRHLSNLPTTMASFLTSLSLTRARTSSSSTVKRCSARSSARTSLAIWCASSGAAPAWARVCARMPREKGVSRSALTILMSRSSIEHPQRRLFKPLVAEDAEAPVLPPPSPPHPVINEQQKANKHQRHQRHVEQPQDAPNQRHHVLHDAQEPGRDPGRLDLGRWSQERLEHRYGARDDRTGDEVGRERGESVRQRHRAERGHRPQQ